MRALIAVLTIVVPLMLVFLIAAIDRYHPFLDRLADTMFGGDS